MNRMYGWPCRLVSAVVALTIVHGTSAFPAEAPANTSECEILVTDHLESEVIDATDHGTYLLWKWVDSKEGHEVAPFWKKGMLEKAVPRIDGYTQTHANGLSADDIVLGTALRSVRDPRGGGASVALVWNPQTGEITRLPFLDAYQASYGYSISADGKSVCGYQVKAGTGNLPVVWTKNVDGTWHCRPLPAIYEDNPRLTTAGMRISPNGNIVVAPITVDILSNAVNPYVSDTFMWTKGTSGSWSRQVRSKGGLTVHAVNDQGTFVGHLTRRVDGVPYPCAYVCTRESGVETIGVLDGDIASDACDINNDGTVVGWSTDPYGPSDPEKDVGYDDPFVWTAKDGMRKIVIASSPSKGAHGSATAITDGNRIGGRVTIVDEQHEPAFTAVLR